MKSAGAILPSKSGSISRRARREKARKSSAYTSTTAGNTEEEREYRVAQHMDMLEGVTDVALEVEDDEEYDELEEFEDNDDEVKKGSKRKRRKRPSNASSLVPKYLKARSLASILIEEANRTDSVAKDYVSAAVSSKSTTKPRKFCPVTGLFGTYTDPKSGISYASLRALEQIRERAPPWINGGGSGAYWEACKTLRNDG